MNYVHKTEFLPGGLNWEYKMKYEKPTNAFSFLANPKKAEVEFEFEPKTFKTPDSILRFKLKETISSNPAPGVSDNKFLSWLKNWNCDHEAEAKFAFTPELFHTLKVAGNCAGSCIPKAKFTTLFNKKPLLCGINYNFDYGKNKYTDVAEILLGTNHYKNITTYIKHQTRSFEYPGTVIVGIHDKENFECHCEKKTKKGVTEKKVKLPTEFGAETSFDLKDIAKFVAKVATKVNVGKKYIFQTMYDSDFKLTSAYTYMPKKGFKLIWSDQINTKELIMNPAGKIYNYGFTVELNL